MNRWRKLPGRVRWQIAGVLALFAALVLCLTAGAAGLALWQARSAPQATATKLSTPGAGTVTTTASPTSTLAESPTSAQGSPTATATVSPIPTFILPPPAATRTPVPPTATDSPVPMPDLRCDAIQDLGKDANGEQVFRGYYSNGGEASSGSGFRLAWRAGQSSYDYDDVQELPANYSSTNQYNRPLSGGTWTITFIVDFEDEVAESNENNNSCEITITTLQITVAPATLAP